MNIKGPFTRVSFERFNLNSHEQIKNYLLTQGWEPTQWNTKKGPNGEIIKTSPKLTEDSYDSIQGDIGKLIARRNVLVHRRNTIENIKDPDNKGWIQNVRSDGRIAAEAVPMACNTGRYQHRVIVNVPKASEKVVYGKEMRSLFTVPPEYDMVGVDAKALEARTEAHNCYQFKGGIEYAKELLEGDIHSKNAVLFETDRDGAKSPKYLLTYGGKKDKLRATLKCDIKKASRLYDNFWNGNTALMGCKKALERAYKSRGGKNKGYIIGLDGRKLFPRSLHSIVNLKFQSDGALLVKRAIVILFLQLIPEAGIDARLLLTMHDELQAQVRKEDSDKYMELALKAFEMAGEFYNYNVPILGDAKKGKNWAMTH